LVNPVEIIVQYTPNKSIPYTLVNPVEIIVQYNPNNPTYLLFSPSLLLVHNLDTSFLYNYFFIFHSHS
jgi:hypothetical protein